MSDITAFVKQRSVDGLLSWPDQVEAAERFNLSCAQVEEAALAEGVMPARYQRNRQMISTQEQLTLLRSTVAVVGCGGLGGYIVEQLARLGVGTIVAIDPDVFEEHNLNRQLLSSPQDLGRVKAERAVERVAEVNPVVTVHPIKAAFSGGNGRELLAGVDVVADAVDNIPTRMALAETCFDLQLPLVHGAIGGWYGHVCTIYPGEETLQKIYRNWTGGKGVEQELGNPSFTPAVVASLEVTEVCKILLGKGALLRGRVLSVNLLDMEVEEIPL